MHAIRHLYDCYDCGALWASPPLPVATGRGHDDEPGLEVVDVVLAPFGFCTPCADKRRAKQDLL